MPCASWIGFDADGALRAEDLDHADDGAEESEQRRHRGDRAERGQEALEVVRDDAADFLDRLLHHRPRRLHVGEARGEDAAERALRRRPARAARASRPVCRNSASTRSTMPARRDDGLPQRPQALEDQRERDDGSDDQRPDRPARCLDDRPHEDDAPNRKGRPQCSVPSLDSARKRPDRTSRIMSVAPPASASDAVTAAPASTIIQNTKIQSRNSGSAASAPYRIS